jgi:hypothetical protein
MNRPPTKYGFSLVEVVAYVGLFSVFSVLALNAIVDVMHAFGGLRVSRDINDSAVKAIERMTRDIKNAREIDFLQSTFGVHPGALSLTVMSASGTPMTVRYAIGADQKLHIFENGTDRGSILIARTVVDGLVFRLVNTGSTLGVKTELHLSSTRAGATATEHFNNTSMLRGSY